MRIDLSNQLVHLTRGSLTDAEASFRSIVKERRLLGSNRGIRGGHTVTCFSEAPIDVLAKMFRSDGHGFRYRPFGVMIPKDWLFERGGRPVLYQPEAEFELLPVDLQYRHVRFDSPGSEKDFSFEREWRIAAAEVPLDPKFCTLVVPDREWDYKLREEHDERDVAKARYLRMNPLHASANMSGTCSRLEISGPNSRSMTMRPNPSFKRTHASRLRRLSRSA